jgi:hypothetical protein
MQKTVVGVVEKPLDAQRIIDELVQNCLCDRSNISVMLRDPAALGSEVAATVTKAVDTTVAAANSVLGGIFGGVEAVSRSIPGGGMLRGVGALGVALANAGLGTAAGVAKALVEAGVSKEHASRYGQAFERGGILIAVQAKTDGIARCAHEVLMKHGALMSEAGAAH